MTTIWSAAGGACLALGLMHLLVWCGNRKQAASLWFAGIAVSVAAMAWFEGSIAYVTDPEGFYSLHRWGHLCFFITVACVAGFIRSYFGTVRPWLLWVFLGLRAIILLLTFVPGPTFNFQEITSLEPYQFLGDTLMAPVGTRTPWEFLGNLSGILLVAYVADAGIRLWKSGESRERQRALVISTGLLLFLISCIINGLLIHREILQVPYYITLSFLFIVVAMVIELSQDIRHASSIADELKESAESMRLAAEAVHLALWRWEIKKDQIWVSHNGREMYGIPPNETIDLQRFLDTLAVDDQLSTTEAVQKSLAGNGDFEAEYRVKHPDGQERWIGAHGHVEFDSKQQPVRMRGISIDITEHRAAKRDASRHLAELTRLTRVDSLSHLSGLFAHELVQPLAIILSNAHAAKRLLAKPDPDLAGLDEIIDDIIGEDQRAELVIQRLRSMVKLEDSRCERLSVNDIITEVLQLTRHDLSEKGITVEHTHEAELPEIDGDRIQLQQLLLNLIINASDAMSNNAPGKRKLTIRSSREPESIRVCIEDQGPGIPGDPEQLFESFFTTKKEGLGMGLAICRTICRSHGGRIWAESRPDGGAAFLFELPYVQSKPS